MSPGFAILGAAIALIWCGVELRNGYRLVGRGQVDVAQANFQAAVVAGFLVIGFVVASGAIP